MSSSQERIDMVASPPQHIGPCATQLTIASARTQVHLPRSRSHSDQSKPKNWTRIVPRPGPNNNLTSVVIKNNDTTFASMGFNHLPQVKGERIESPVASPSLKATPNFSIIII